jgi:hypothetical protein
MPQRLKASSLAKNINENSSAVGDGKGNIRWVPTRPLPHYFGLIRNIIERLKMAKDVFKGKADALYWDGDQ